MADDQAEQGGLTERFQSFAEQVDPEPNRTLPLALIASGAVLVLVLIAVVVFLLNG